MTTVSEILAEFKTFKTRVDEYYSLIYEEVNSDASLNGLTSTSKTAEFNLWMWLFAGMSVILDGIWSERKTEISEIVKSGIPGTDRWFQLELFKFQYGDALSFDAVTGKYFYVLIDTTKQIITRCAVISSGGVTAIKVAKDDGSGNPIALVSDELTAFTAYVRQIQWAGANVLNPTSAASDKLDAPMTVYYDGTIKLADIKVIVQTAFNDYLKALPFNGEYSVNKHGDFVESKSSSIKEVTMGIVRAKAHGGAYSNVNRVYTPVAGYIERDTAIAFDTMITYVAQ